MSDWIFAVVLAIGAFLVYYIVIPYFLDLVSKLVMISDTGGKKMEVRGFHIVSAILSGFQIFLGCLFLV